MLAMDNPMCAERFYLDQPVASDSNTDQSWRRLGSSDSYDESNMWSPPTSTCGSTFSMPKASQDSANWKDKPVEQWSADEVTLWICSLMSGQSRSPFDTSSYCPAVNVAAYLNLTGAELLTLSNSDMQTRDPQSGSFVYLSLQNHLNQIHQFNIPQSFPHMENLHGNNNNLPAQRPDCVKQEPKEFLPPRLPSLDLKLISFDVEDHFDSIKSLAKDISNVDQLVRNLQAMRCPDKQQLAPPSFPNHGNGYPAHPQMNLPMKHWGEQMQQTCSPMASPGSDGSGTTADDVFNGTYYQNEVKGNHLWEFIRDLLFDSRYNPSLVKWEDREEGIFKFVKSDQVAKLWGKKKNNPAMTYEKLSRAMRYYYRRKILERIDGRRLVYKFGSMATGWKP